MRRLALDRLWLSVVIGGKIESKAVNDSMTIYFQIPFQEVLGSLNIMSLIEFVFDNALVPVKLGLLGPEMPCQNLWLESPTRIKSGHHIGTNP